MILVFPLFDVLQHSVRYKRSVDRVGKTFLINNHRKFAGCCGMLVMCIFLSLSSVIRLWILKYLQQQSSAYLKPSFVAKSFLSFLELLPALSSCIFYPLFMVKDCRCDSVQISPQLSGLTL